MGVCSAVPRPLQPHGLQPTRLLCPGHHAWQEYCSGLPFPSPGDLPNTSMCFAVSSVNHLEFTFTECSVKYGTILSQLTTLSKSFKKQQKTGDRSNAKTGSQEETVRVWETLLEYFSIFWNVKISNIKPAFRCKKHSKYHSHRILNVFVIWG